jgi:hypothetical protein
MHLLPTPAARLRGKNRQAALGRWLLDSGITEEQMDVFALAFSAEAPASECVHLAEVLAPQPT